MWIRNPRNQVPGPIERVIMLPNINSKFKGVVPPKRAKNIRMVMTSAPVMPAVNA
ncbi:hypothetical protein D3C83_198470 [compost metagenome]